MPHYILRIPEVNFYDIFKRHYTKRKYSWDDGATEGNSLENLFPEYLAVMLSRCIGWQERQQIFSPSRLFFSFLVLERAKKSVCQLH
jgi:hypothetical protein